MRSCTVLPGWRRCLSSNCAGSPGILLPITSVLEERMRKSFAYPTHNFSKLPHGVVVLRSSSEHCSSPRRSRRDDDASLAAELFGVDQCTIDFCSTCRSLVRFGTRHEELRKTRLGFRLAYERAAVAESAISCAVAISNRAISSTRTAVMKIALFSCAPRRCGVSTVVRSMAIKVLGAPIRR